MGSVVAAGTCAVIGLASGPAIASAATRTADGLPLLASGWWWGRGANRDLLLVASPMSTVVLAAAGARLGWAAPLPAVCWLAITGLALALVDLRRHRLPNVLVAAAGCGGLGFLLAASVATRSLIALGRSAATVFIVFASLITIALAWPGQLGLGDIKFAGVLAGYLGWFGWQAVCTAGLLTGLCAIAALVLGRARRRRGVAAGPGLVASTVCTLLLPPQAVPW